MRCMLLLTDLSSKLEFYAGLKATNWASVAETLKPWSEKTVSEVPLHKLVPALKHFTVDRILG